MAVMVSPLTISNLRRQIVNHRIKLLVEANEEVNNNLYYFSLKQVNFAEEKITGYYWHSGLSGGCVKSFHSLIFYI
jgi:hypothetical protein